MLAAPQGSVPPPTGNPVSATDVSLRNHKFIQTVSKILLFDLSMTLILKTFNPELEINLVFEIASIDCNMCDMFARLTLALTS